MTIDEYIARLQRLREQHGNVECWAGGGDYPEGATGPWYITERRSDGYRPAGAVMLE